VKFRILYKAQGGLSHKMVEIGETKVFYGRAERVKYESKSIK
jgi:hypothetical protein